MAVSEGKPTAQITAFVEGLAFLGGGVRGGVPSLLRWMVEGGGGATLPLYWGGRIGQSPRRLSCDTVGVPIFRFLGLPLKLCKIELCFF